MLQPIQISREGYLYSIALTSVRVALLHYSVAVVIIHCYGGAPHYVSLCVWGSSYS